MRRSGFTMVELIFVIIIIGILSVAAIPKFGDIKDRAKVNSEYNSLSGLDGAIEAAIQFQEEDNDNMGVLWHNQAAGTAETDYSTINTNKKVLSKIVKKGDDLKIVGYVDLDTDGTDADNKMEYDVLFIEGAASNHTTGVRQKSEGDVAGKPDKNDVWVFNTSPADITIKGDDVTDSNISSGELKLIDASTTLNYGTNINAYFEGNTTALTINTL